MIILNIVPQLILILIGVPILLYVYSVYSDKKTKPRRDESNMTKITSTILIYRFIKEKQSSDSDTKKLCKEMLCDIFYVLNLFYREKYNFLNEKNFNIQSSERQEKLKLEFSELYKKIVSGEYEKIYEEFGAEYQSDKAVIHNLSLTHQLINSYKKDQDWNRNLTSFWQIIYISFGYYCFIGTDESSLS